MNAIEIKVPDISTELQAAFLEIQQPRSDYALEHFVVGDNFGSKTREYMQIVEELRRAHSSIKRGLLERKKLEIERGNLREKGDEISKIEADMKDIDIDEVLAGLIGKIREFNCLVALWGKYPKFTHKELQDSEVEYWATNLRVQASRDLIERRTGISVRAQHGMERAGLAPQPRLELLIPAIPNPELPQQNQERLPTE
jgi:hypothetical protein